MSTPPLAIVMSIAHHQFGRGDAARCDECGRFFIPRGPKQHRCRLCGRTDETVCIQVRSDGTAWNLLQQGKWQPHPYTKAYMTACGYEIARCAGCGCMRYKPVGANCERCSNTCGELFGGIQ